MAPFSIEGASTKSGAVQYFHFTGDGVVDGPISVLTYELFGTNSVPAFGPGGTISGAVAPMQLAAGSLISGSTGTINGQQGAGVSVTFNASSTPFFAAPSAPSFYSVALSSFIHAEGTVTPTANGFMIDNGGGSLHFATPIPEPHTYGLMLAGLGVFGFVARRRRQG